MYRTNEAHPASSLSTMDVLRKEGKLCDVTIQAEGRLFSAHKVVLACSSPYFQAMFAGRMEESRRSAVTILDVPALAMELLLDYCYTSTISITEDNVHYVLVAAGILQLGWVKEVCSEFMRNKMDSSNCLGIRAFADTHCCHELQEAADSYAAQHYLEVLEAGEFLEMDCEAFTTLLASDYLNIESEEQVFESVMKWIRHNEEERKADLLKVLKHVRLPLMERGYLVVRVEKEPLIRRDKDCMDLVDEAKKYPLFPEERSALEGPRTRPRRPRLHPGVRLQWRRCADAPVKMSRAQAIVVGEKVYMRGTTECVYGGTTDSGDTHKVFQYNRRGDTWSTLPHCPVSWFGMAHFMSRIITVGGVNHLRQDSLSNKVYTMMEGSQQWEEFVSPMPTSRYGLLVATTSVAIIAAGGRVATQACSSAVEVYSSDTSQWHTAEPLPIPCTVMSSVIINDTWYLLGGQSGRANNSCWSAPIQSLVHGAVSQSASGSVWNHLPPTPLCLSTAACLSWSLVAVGGENDDNTRSSAVYGFLNDSWVRLSNGDLLSPRSLCATAQLSPLEVIVIGGYDEQDQKSKTVFIGTLHS